MVKVQNSPYNHNLNFNYKTDSNLTEVKDTFVVISDMLISLICFVQALWCLVIFSSTRHLACSVI